MNQDTASQEVHEFKVTILKGTKQLRKILVSILKWSKKNIFLILIPTYIVVFTVFSLISFPEEFKYIEAQKFESHPYKDLTPFFRSLNKMKPKIYNDTKISFCEDIQVTRSDILYCANQKNQIIQLDDERNKSEILGQVLKGTINGIRLSRDQKILYFVNSQIGLCQLNLETGDVSSLVTQYRGQPLISLNSIQTHPTDPNIIYLTQSSSVIPLHYFNIDILLNNPFGRLFQFNKKSQKLSLLADGLYFPYGLAFQKYRGQDTLLVAESNRFKITRFYLQGLLRGIKQIAIDKLDIYLGNMKTNQKGQIWVAGFGIRTPFLKYADHNPWIRKVYSRLPSLMFSNLLGNNQFGGILIKFFQNQSDYEIKYCLWNSYRNYKSTSTLIQKNNKLYISSLWYKGVLAIKNIHSKLSRKQGNRDLKRDSDYLS